MDYSANKGVIMKEYRNKELIEIADENAKGIIALDPKNDRRENFFPMLIDSMGLKTVVEVGVDKGQFSHCLLSKSKLEKFYGIDPWINDFGSDHRPGFFDPNGENRMKEAIDRLAEFGDRVELVKNYSAVAAPYFPNDSIDFVYIDGDHSLEMLFDLYHWFPKVREGGIMAFDDYKDGPNSGMKNYFGEQLPFKVKTALDFFCDKFGLKINVTGGRVPNAWFVKNRKTI
jgi:hypothetical protein